MFDRSSVTRIGSATFSRIEIEAVALAAHGDLGLSHALHLSLELVRGAAQVGDVAEHRQHGVLGADAFAERMREHLEQQIIAFVGIDEIELARSRLLPARHRGLGQERREEQIVQLDGPAAAGRIAVVAVEQSIGAMILRDDVVGGVGDHDRIGQRVDHQLEVVLAAGSSASTIRRARARATPAARRRGWRA